MKKTSKFNIAGIGKKLIVAIVIVLCIIVSVVIVSNCFSTDKNKDNSPEVSSIQEKTSRNDVFYITYDSKSEIKSGSYVNVKDVIKYEANYTNSSKDVANSVISIELSKGLDYVKNSSSIGDPLITKGKNETTVLTYKRTLLGGVREKLNFSVIVNDKAIGEVSTLMSFKINDKQVETSKLTNKLGDIVVTYKSGENGKIKGNKEENVGYGKPLQGVTIVPNSGYKVKGFASNVDVKLSDGEKVKKGDLIKLNLLNKVIPEKDMVLTAKYESAGKEYRVTYMIDNKVNQVQSVFSNEKFVLKKVTLSEKCVIDRWKTANKTYSAGDVVKIKQDTIFSGVSKCANKESKSNKVSKDRYISEDEVKSNKRTLILGIVTAVICLVVLIVIIKKRNK